LVVKSRRRGAIFAATQTIAQKASGDEEDAMRPDAVRFDAADLVNRIERLS